MSSTSFPNERDKIKWCFYLFWNLISLVFTHRNNNVFPLPTGFFLTNGFWMTWLFKKAETVSWIIIFMSRTATRLQRSVLRIAHHDNIIINGLLWYKPLHILWAIINDIAVRYWDWCTRCLINYNIRYLCIINELLCSKDVERQYYYNL